MKTPALDAAIAHLEWSIKHTWECVNGPSATAEISCFLDPCLVQLVVGFQMLTEARKTLEAQEPL